jgi:hypothetical protein
MHKSVGEMKIGSCFGQRVLLLHENCFYEKLSLAGCRGGATAE